MNLSTFFGVTQELSPEKHNKDLLEIRQWWNDHNEGKRTWDRMIFNGTPTNDSASAGNVGEYTSSTISTPAAYPTSTQWGDLTSISLTAGDWDVMGTVNGTINGATMTGGVFSGITTVSGNTGPAAGLYYGMVPPTATSDVATTSFLRISTASTISVYLKFYAAYSAGTPKALGFMSARRMR